MKLKLFYTLLILLGLTSLFSNTLEVSLDGTKPCTEIQMAVNQASTGDTVLVYPGTYYENVDLSYANNLKLYSLEAITNDSTFISTTIIDGNQSGSTLYCTVGDKEFEIRGLSITGGSGYQDGTKTIGGGLCLALSSFNIVNLQIYDNYADLGGGIIINYQATVHLAACTINNNLALMSGGGICTQGTVSEQPTITFSESNRCSLYDNYASLGADMYWELPFGAVSDIYLDKFTKASYERYYVNFFEGFVEAIEDGYTPYRTFDVNEGMHEEVDEDLYVDNNGDDNNSGLTPDQALRTIYRANTIISSNRDNPKTIRLTSEIYEHNLWGHTNIPIGLKSNTILQGVSAEETKIIGNPNIYSWGNGTIIPEFFGENITIKDMSISNGEGSAVLTTCIDNFTIENVVFEASNINSWTTLYVDGIYISKVKLDNVIFQNNHSIKSYPAFSIKALDVVMNNVKVYNNTCINENGKGIGNVVAMNRVEVTNSEFIDNHCTSDYYGWTLFRFIDWADSLEVVIDNCLFANNVAGECKMFANMGENTTISNCTFANNSGCPNFGTIMNSGTNTVYRNNIFMNNNQPWDLSLTNEVLDIDNCLFGDSDLEVSNLSGAELILGDNNIYNQDPLFVGGDPALASYYHLRGGDIGEVSPAIDAGNSSFAWLPEWFVPAELDLYGNPRIHNNIIDLGCYEFPGYTPNIDDGLELVTELNATNYPNPFNPTTSINFNNNLDKNVNITIYNIKGQKVKTVANDVFARGNNTVVWNGDDDNGKKVATGLYFIKIKSGKMATTKKIMLMK